MSRTPWHVVLAGCLLAACDDGALRAFQPRASAPGGAGAAGSNAEAGGGSGGTMSSEPTAGTGGSESGEPMAGAGGSESSTSRIIDDFEDGDARAKEPLGWWYPVNDETGTQGFGIEPVSRGTASVYALQTHGSGFRDWGAAVGVNLVGDSTPLNALSYENLCFSARVDAGNSALLQAHLLRQGEPLHYSQEVSLSESWNRYCLPLVDFLQPDGAPLVPSELIALQIFFPPGAPFAFWLDDVEVQP